jgi:hypothetical protein
LNFAAGGWVVPDQIVRQPWPVTRRRYQKVHLMLNGRKFNLCFKKHLGGARFVAPFSFHEKMSHQLNGG